MALCVGGAWRQSIRRRLFPWQADLPQEIPIPSASDIHDHSHWTLLDQHSHLSLDVRISPRKMEPSLVSSHHTEGFAVFYARGNRNKWQYYNHCPTKKADIAEVSILYPRWQSGYQVISWNNRDDSEQITSEKTSWQRRILATSESKEQNPDVPILLQMIIFNFLESN